MKVSQNFQNFRVLWHGRTELPEVPGRYKHAVHVPRVFVAPAYRTSRSSAYGYNCPTEVTEVLRRVIPGINTPGMDVCNIHTERKQKIRVHCTDTNVVHNSQKSGVRAIPGLIPASKVAKKQIDWSKKDTNNCQRISTTAIGILHTLLLRI